MAADPLGLRTCQFDKLYLCWPCQNNVMLLGTVPSVRHFVHALRNAKMYNKSFSQCVPLGLCEGQVFEGWHDSLSGIQTIMRLILVDLKSEPLKLS